MPAILSGRTRQRLARRAKEREQCTKTQVEEARPSSGSRYVGRLIRGDVFVLVVGLVSLFARPRPAQRTVKQKEPGRERRAMSLSLFHSLSLSCARVAKSKPNEACLFAIVGRPRERKTSPRLTGMKETRGGERCELAGTEGGAGGRTDSRTLLRSLQWRPAIIPRA